MKQEYDQLQNEIKIVFILKLFFYKNHFSISFASFNSNGGYGNQRRLFSGNLPAMYFVCANEIKVLSNLTCITLKMLFLTFKMI